MALADTSKAIGVVTETLKSRIARLSDIADVSIGRPDETKGTTGLGDARLNLFLYEIHLDEHLKNTPLNEGQKPPLWLVLKYLVTAFDQDKTSNNIAAHKHLGAAMRAVGTDGLLTIDGLTGEAFKALSPNPESLQVTFDDAPADLLGKLMQGSEEQLRISFCFQVRPVMVAAAEPGNYSLLVGVDYTNPPNLSDPYVGIDVIPSMGPHIDEISPVGFELNEIEPEEVTIIGTDLHLSGLSVMLGPVDLPVTMQQPEKLRFKVDPTIIKASGISAGSHPICVVENLAKTGKRRKSNSVIGNLVPTLDSVVPGAAVIDDPGLPIRSHRDIKLTGKMIGVDEDDIIIAFYQNGQVIKMFDVFIPLPPAVPPGQLTRHFVLSSHDGIPAGVYNVILSVNGQQAPQSPLINFTWP
jgi:hypothetical protein